MHLIKVKRDFGVLQIDYNKVGDIMASVAGSKDKEPLVAIMACGILSDEMEVSQRPTASL